MIVGALLLGLADTAYAQSDYPSKPIRVVIPYPPGGPSDLVARLIANKMAESLRQTVVSDNRPGGGSLIGAEAVVRAAPDGYTVLSASGAPLSRVFVKNPPFEVLRDLSPISRTYGGGLMVLTNDQISAGSLRGLFDYAKANPGKLNYGFTAPTTMLLAAILKKVASVDTTPVGYKGSAPLTLALVRGDVQVTIDSPLPYLPYIQSGKVRALAIGSEQRMSILPDVPTMTEAGYPWLKAEYNSGIWAPAGTQREIIDRLNAAVVAAVSAAEVQESIRKAGLYPVSSSPDAFRQLVRSEIEFWADAAKIANYQPE
jgi:tripartite-type tricarboxylate transporter receptor subunit TctC